MHTSPNAAHHGTASDDAQLMTDGGRDLTTNPATCPACGARLVGGECPTDGCDGPEDDE